MSQGACASPILEYILWVKAAFQEPAEVVDGHFLRPEQAGAGTTPTPEAFQRYAQPLG